MSNCQTIWTLASMASLLLNLSILPITWRTIINLFLANSKFRDIPMAGNISDIS